MSWGSRVARAGGQEAQSWRFGGAWVTNHQPETHGQAPAPSCATGGEGRGHREGSGSTWQRGRVLQGRQGARGWLPVVPLTRPGWLSGQRFPGPSFRAFFFYLVLFAPAAHRTSVPGAPTSRQPCTRPRGQRARGPEGWPAACLHTAGCAAWERQALAGAQEEQGSFTLSSEATGWGRPAWGAASLRSSRRTEPEVPSASCRRRPRRVGGLSEFFLSSC